MIRIELHPREQHVAGTVGLTRRVEAQANGQTTVVGTPSFEQDVLGASSELAVAKALGLYWAGVPAKAKWDVSFLQVRSTKRRNGALIVKPHESDDDIFVLVSAADQPIYEVIGFMRGSSAKQDQFYRDDVPFPAYFVPQGALLDDWAMLIKYVAGKLIDKLGELNGSSKNTKGSS